MAKKPVTKPATREVSVTFGMVVDGITTDEELENIFRRCLNFAQLLQLKVITIKHIK